METTSIKGIIYNINQLRPFVESITPVEVELSAFHEASHHCINIGLTLIINQLALQIF
jgi:hypothetical protein